MAEYFILYFQAPSLDNAVLQKWLLEEDQPAGPEQPLFSYLNGGHKAVYSSPVPGLFKVHLTKEGRQLQAGAEVAVLSVEEPEAKRAAAQGLGKIIKPEELDETIAHAEAASIRLPPES